MSYQAINFQQTFDLFSEQWTANVFSEMNDNQFKVVELEGDFVRHSHPETEEAFIVIKGWLRIDFRESAVEIDAGEMFVVPKGVVHKPYAEREVKLMLVEPRDVLNTGDQVSERAAQNDAWIRRATTALEIV